jgi:hypothetical protein
MNEQPPTPSADPQPAALSELRDAHESLRTLFQLSVLCGIVLSASVSFLVFKQVAAIHRQSAGLQAMIGDHNTNWSPRLHFARTNLEAYAAKDPSVAPIIQKYFSTNTYNSARTAPPSLGVGAPKRP